MAGYRAKNTGNKSGSRTGVAVSRRLKAAGWNISPAAHRGMNSGIFVSAQQTHVSVLVDLGIPAKNLRLAKAMAAELVHWDCVPDTVDVTGPTRHGVCYIDFQYRKEAASAPAVPAWEQLALW